MLLWGKLQSPEETAPNAGTGFVLWAGESPLDLPTDLVSHRPAFSKEFHVSHSTEGFSKAQFPWFGMVLCDLLVRNCIIFCTILHKSQLQFFSLLGAVLWITNPTLFLCVFFWIYFMSSSYRKGKKMQLLSLSPFGTAATDEERAINMSG